MGFNKLPHELKYKISEYLNTTSLVSLIQSGQRELDNNFLWKQKCHKEYSFYSDRIKNWKEKYKKLYFTKCIHCHKNTKLYNDFYKVKICRKCELENTKYHTLSHSKVKKKYFLNEEELKTFKYIYRVNPYNYNQQIKLYLKDDIMRFITDSEGNFIEPIKQRMDKYTNSEMEKLYKFGIMLRILINTYNISNNNLANVLSNLNLYSQGLYQKFMRYNNRPITPVIHKALELDFIYTYSDLSSNYYASNNFEKFIYNYLITNTNVILPLNINKYIDLFIYKFNISHQESIKRKKEVLEIYNDINIRISIINILKINVIYKYIKFGTIFKLRGVNSQIKAHMLLHDFLYVNTDIQTILFENNITNKIIDKYSLYIITLKRWYNNNPHLHYILPKELYPLIFKDDQFT